MSSLPILLICGYLCIGAGVAWFFVSIFERKRILNDATKHMLEEMERHAMQLEIQRMGVLFNNLTMPLWLRDAELNIQHCNKAYTEVVSDTPLDSAELALIPELHRKSRDIAQKAYELQSEYTQEVHLVVGGKRVPYHLSERWVPTANVMIGMAQDISQQYEAREEIEAYRCAQEELLESSTSAIAVYDANMQLRYFNQSFVRLWRYDEKLLNTHPYFPDLLEDLRSRRMLPEQVNFKTYKQERIQVFSNLRESEEALHFLPDGRTIRSIAIPHALGGILFSYEDVTDRLALERSYNTLIAVQRETLDNLHEGVIVFGEDGCVRLSNPVFQKMWDLQAHDIDQGIHVRKVLEKMRPRLRFHDWADFTSDFISRAQSRQLHANRIERRDDMLFDWAMVPLPDGGTLITFLDVTDSAVVQRSLSEKNEALQTVDRLKTQFLTNISYELRSPLTSIMGFSEMLKQHYLGDLTEAQTEYVEGIYHSSRRLMLLINDILDLASIEAGYMTIDIHSFEVETLLHAALAQVSERVREHKITVNIVVEDAAKTMQADEARLRQVMGHVLNNAVKYSPEGGNITLGARATEGGTELYVHDEGEGISEEEQKAVFNAFYRGRSKSTSGMGLGLSMVKSLVQLHGGSVRISSIKGEGTEVVCFIPSCTVASIDGVNLH